MIEAIILSRDKACQLDLLLTSIQRNSKNLFSLKVIYEASNKSFEQGYNKLKEKFYYKDRHGLNFPIKWHERSSKNLSLDIVNVLNRGSDLTCIFNDENILFSATPSYKKIINFFRKEPVAALSLRIGDNTVIQNPYSVDKYFIDKPEEFSLIDEVFVAWNASSLEPFTNFSMPFSHNGHIYTTKLIEYILKQTEINSIEDFETLLQKDLYSGQFEGFIPPYISCLQSSILVTNSATKISDDEEFEQKFDTSEFSVNERYLNGYEIDYDFFDFSNISKPFQEHITRFRRENHMQYGC